MNLARFALAGFALVAAAAAGFGIFRAVSEQRESDALSAKKAAEKAARNRAIAAAQAASGQDSDSGGGWTDFGNFLRGLDEQIVRIAQLFI